MGKNLSKYQVKPLVIELGGKNYAVPPPSSTRGAMLARIVTMGLHAALEPGSITDDSITTILGEETMAELSNDKDFGLERLSLTAEVFQQMFDDKVPLADIAMAARYSSLYWVFDEATADRAIESEHQARLNPAEEIPLGETELPKPSPSGESTDALEQSDPTALSLLTTSLHT